MSAVQKTERPLGLANIRWPQYGHQLSSFSALEQCKKTKALFAVNESPLKA